MTEEHLPILLVGSPRWLEATASAVERVARVEVASGAGEIGPARACGATRFSGVVIHASVPGDDPIAAVRALRARGVASPLLLVLARDAPALANEAHLLGASCIYPPRTEAGVVRFARRAALDAAARARRLERALASVTGRLQLTKRESEVVRLTLRGVPRARFAEALGVSENTVKTLVRRVLAKSSEDHADVVARAVLEELLETARAPGA